MELPSGSVTVMGVAVNGGGTFVKVVHAPLLKSLFTCTVFVRPTVGTKVNWKKPGVWLTGAVIWRGNGFVTASTATELVMAPAELVMTTV